jgi:hypothetical protein
MLVKKVLICHNDSVNKNYERTKAMNTIIKNSVLHIAPAQLRAPRRSFISRALQNVYAENIIV